jgi:hypothetical protein
MAAESTGGGGGLLGSIGSGFLKGITGGIGDLFGGSESEESGGYWLTSVGATWTTRSA